jgi:hypothetical protein
MARQHLSFASSRNMVKIACAITAPLLAVAFALPATVSAATITTVPCTGSGGGADGLVAAVNAANASGGGIINLVQGCTYRLVSANNVNPAFGDANGLPVITSKITIDGSGGNNQQSGESDSSGATIAGNGRDLRVLEVDGPYGDLTLQEITITKGFANAGAGILNLEGRLTVNHSQVRGNTGRMGGGGIASGTGNVGPIGTTTLSFSQVNGNAALSGGGGGILNHAGTLTVNHSEVNNNVSKGGGGGIASGPGNGGVAGNSTLIVTFSQVNNNLSTGGPFAGAGGIANGGVATIAHSQVDNNSAPGAPGGGIFNHGTITIDQSEVNGNKALTDSQGNHGFGGGIANVSFTAAFGVPPASLRLNHSDVNGNTATGDGGGIFEGGVNPASNPPSLDAAGGPLSLDHSLVTLNSAASGGGIWVSPGSPVTSVHTQIVENTPDNCFLHGTVPGCSG